MFTTTEIDLCEPEKLAAPPDVHRVWPSGGAAGIVRILIFLLGDGEYTPTKGTRSTETAIAVRAIRNAVRGGKKFISNPLGAGSPGPTPAARAGILAAIHGWAPRCRPYSKTPTPKRRTRRVGAPSYLTGRCATISRLVSREPFSGRPIQKCIGSQRSSDTSLSEEG